MSWQPEAADWPTLRRGPSDADEHVRDLLPAYLSGTIEPSEVGRVGDHLDRCLGCRAALRSWEVIAGAVRISAATRDRMPGGPLDRVLAAIGDPIQPPVAPDNASPAWLTSTLLPDLAADDQDRGERARSQRMTAPGTLAGSMAGPPPFPRSARRRPLMAELSTAAVFVLVLVGVVAALRLAPDDDQQSVPDAATNATPPAGSAVTVLGPDDAVNLAECSTAPRPAGGVFALIGTEPRTAAVLLDPQGEVDAPPGPEPPDPNSYVADLPRADDSARAGIEATLREMTACRFYALVPDSGPTPRRGGPDSRYMALFSDDFFRRYAVDDALVGATLPFGYAVVGGWVPSGPTPAALGDARALPDGRILALVQPASIRFQLLIVFARPDDRWLVDEFNLIQPRHPSVLATPPAPRPQPRPVDIALWDDLAVSSSGVADGPIAAAGGVTISIANLGTLPQRFEIRPLGYAVVVQPGESVDLLLDVPAGTYHVQSFVENGVDQPAPALDTELVLIDDATPTAVG